MHKTQPHLIEWKCMLKCEEMKKNIKHMFVCASASACNKVKPTLHSIESFDSHCYSILKYIVCTNSITQSVFLVRDDTKERTKRMDDLLTEISISLLYSLRPVFINVLCVKKYFLIFIIANL